MKLTWRPGPLSQLTLALVLLTSTLLLLADLLFNALPSRQAEVRAGQEQLGKILATQVAAQLSADDPDRLQPMLAGLAGQLPGVRGLAVRRADGTVVARADLPGAVPVVPAAGPATLAARPPMTVQLTANGQAWGQLEVLFAPDLRKAWQRWLDEPAVRLVGFVLLAGALCFGLYLRRALQHLDPASVIPDRVQRAFDVMNEGVAVLDARGRVMLVNRAFKALHPEAAAVRAGQPLTGLPWLGNRPATDGEPPPWQRAMSSKQPVHGSPLEIGLDVGRVRQLVVNCAPIADSGGTVRGCLATFDDITELHRANAALHKAMADTQAAREEVERKNVELQRLATRDPLTGCLNRRALHDALAPLWGRSKIDKTPLSCLMLDIDHFKSINDRFGHGVGDRAIQEVARCLQESVRGTDLVCRYGGEEFCVILPGLQEGDIRAHAERIRQKIEAECGPNLRELAELKVTVSVGCVPDAQQMPSMQTMMDRADEALYVAKRGGRNRVAYPEPADAAA